MSVRLLETSLLVFFKKRTTKATIATAVAVSSLTIAQKYKPWLRDSDDKVGRARATRASPPVSVSYTHLTLPTKRIV